MRIVRQALADGDDSTALAARLQEAGLTPDQAAAAADAHRARQDELRAHAVEATSSLSGPHLADVDWKVHVLCVHA